MPKELQDVQEEEMTQEDPVEEVQESHEDVPAELEESEEEVSSESEEVVDKVKSDRGQKRIQELANKAKKAGDLEQEVKDLRSRLTEEPTEKISKEALLEKLKADGIPYTGDYVQDLQIAEERATEKALKRFSEIQSKRERFMMDINSVENEYPELRKGSEKFDPDLTHELVSLYKDASNLNPALPLKSFVDKIMKLRKQSETLGKTTSVEELAKQEQESAVKPTGGIVRQNKEYKDMTFEELEAIAPR